MVAVKNPWANREIRKGRRETLRGKIQADTWQKMDSPPKERKKAQRRNAISGLVSTAALQPLTTSNRP